MPTRALRSAKGAARTAGVLARSCHPEPTAAVTLIGGAYAALGGTGRRAPLVAAAVLAQQLSIGWSNDALDAGRDRSDARADKPLAAGELAPAFVLRAAGAALAASVPLSLLAAGRSDGLRGAGTGRSPALGNLLCAVSGWAYNLGLKATPASPLPYAAGFGGLAAFLDGATHSGDRPATSVVVAGALLGTAAHFANVLPDIDDDLAHGIAGLPQRLGSARSRQACAALLGGAGALLGWTVGRTPVSRPVLGAAMAAPAVLGVALAGTGAHGSRTAFRLVLVVAVVDVGLLLARARARS